MVLLVNYLAKVEHSFFLECRELTWREFNTMREYKVRILLLWIP